MDRVLEAKEINVFYGNVQALRNVSIEVYENEIVTLIGANGAGKTTLMMTLSGILKSKSGSIKFLDSYIHDLAANKIIALGLAQVPQAKHLFPEMTVKENLEIGAYSARNSDINKKFDQVYHYFGILLDRRNQKAGLLSGGEQQMLAFARALMSDCKLLLLDEPSAGLAPIKVEELAIIIKKLSKEQNFTTLIVEQNVTLALELADRGYVLETGCIITEGSALELKNNPIVKKAYLGI